MESKVGKNGRTESIILRADPDAVGSRTKAALKLAMGTVEKCEKCTRFDYTGTNAFKTRAT